MQPVCPECTPPHGMLSAMADIMGVKSAETTNHAPARTLAGAVSVPPPLEYYQSLEIELGMKKNTINDLTEKHAKELWEKQNKIDLLIEENVTLHARAATADADARKLASEVNLLHKALDDKRVPWVAAMASELWHHNRAVCQVEQSVKEAINIYNETEKQLRARQWI